MQLNTADRHHQQQLPFHDFVSIKLHGNDCVTGRYPSHLDAKVHLQSLLVIDVNASKIAISSARNNVRLRVTILVLAPIAEKS